MPPGTYHGSAALRGSLRSVRPTMDVQSFGGDGGGKGDGDGGGGLGDGGGGGDGSSPHSQMVSDVPESIVLKSKKQSRNVADCEHLSFCSSSHDAVHDRSLSAQN